MSDIPKPLNFTEAAASKVSGLIEDENNPELKLRVYIPAVVVLGFSMVLLSMKARPMTIL